MTLYDLKNELLTLLEMAEDPEVDEEVLRDTMEAVTGELEEKAEGYGCIIKQMEHDAAALAAEIKRLQARKKTVEDNKDKLKARLQDAMVATGQKKIKTNLFSFSIGKNPPALSVTSEEEIPEKYWTVPEPVLDREAVKRDLKAGMAVPGAELTQSESLRIR